MLKCSEFHRIVANISMRVIMYADTTINYVVPSKVTSVPVLPVVTTVTGMACLVYTPEKRSLIINAYLSSMPLVDAGTVWSIIHAKLCYRGTCCHHVSVCPSVRLSVCHT